jgi:hypothetical protein
VLDDALTDAKREIQPAVRGVPLLEVFDNPQCVQVVIEPSAMTGEAAIERALTGMSKGRMSDIMNQRKRLSQIFVQAKCGRSGAGDLRDLNGVRQAAAKVIGGTTGEDLRLPRQTSEGTSLHNPFAITLKRRARRAQGRREDAGQKKIVRVSRDRASMEIDCHSQIKV